MSPLPDPRGRWFRVFARQIRQHPKFHDLTGIELGAWLALRSECELRDRSILADRSDAILVLRRRKIPRPAAVLDRLIGLVLFEVWDDGSIAVHDREDHDRPKYPSDDPDAVKERVERHRKNKRSEGGNDTVTSRNESETNPTRARANSGAGADSSSLSEGGESEGRVPEDWDAPDAVVAYHDVTGRYPSQKVIEWLNRLSNDHPDEAIATVMAQQYAADPNLGTLLSRTDTELKLDAHRRAKADQRARDQARMKAEEPDRRAEKEATPEERERAHLQQQAIRIAFKLKIPVPVDPEEVRKFVMKYGAA